VEAATTELQWWRICSDEGTATTTDWLTCSGGRLVEV